MRRVLPILFNTNMVRAILDGRKTVIAYVNPETGDCHKLTEMCKYQPGDILYVWEMWRVGAWDIRNQMIAFDYKDGTCGKFTYINDREMFERLVIQSREDARKAGCEYNGGDFIWEKGKSPCRWHPFIHMPREAARIWLKVTDVRVVQIKDMTLDDFISEGITLLPEAYNDPENAYQQAKGAFVELIKQIYPDCTEDSWFLVIEFERCGKPEWESE